MRPGDPGGTQPVRLLKVPDSLLGPGSVEPVHWAWGSPYSRKAQLQAPHGMGSASCMHPNSGAVNDRATGTATGYDTLHNPFIYFHSLLDLGDCAADDVDISHLGRALSTSTRTPAFAFIAPGVCADATSVAGPTLRRRRGRQYTGCRCSTAFPNGLAEFSIG